MTGPADSFVLLFMVLFRQKTRLQCLRCGFRIGGRRSGSRYGYRMSSSSSSVVPSSVNITAAFRSEAQNCARAKKEESAVKSRSQDEPSLFKDYRNLMARLPVPVVVLTTSSLNGSIHRGMTLSSLTSLSIPQKKDRTVKTRPLISFNIRVPSHTASSLDEQSRFIINVLPPTNESARICRTFSGSLGAMIDPFSRVGWHWGRWIDDREGAAENHSSSKDLDCPDLRIPVLDTAGAVMYCTRIKSMPFYDHELCVAEVSKIQVRPLELELRHNSSGEKIPGSTTSSSAARQPANDGMEEFSSIMYFERRFQDISGDILVNDGQNHNDPHSKKP